AELPPAVVNKNAQRHGQLGLPAGNLRILPPYQDFFLDFAGTIVQTKRTHFWVCSPSLGAPYCGEASLTSPGRCLPHALPKGPVMRMSAWSLRRRSLPTVPRAMPTVVADWRTRRPIAPMS